MDFTRLISLYNPVAWKDEQETTASSPSSYPATRQYPKKLAEDIFKPSKKYFFKLSTVQLWKSFSQDAVDAKSLPRFKEQLKRKTH